MSTYDLYHRAQQAPGLSQTQKGILVALLTFADADGWAWPAVATLATYASVKERSAQSAIADLVAAGLLLRVERPGSTCRFRILLDRLPERGVRPAPPQQMHPRSKDTPAPDAGEGCTKYTPGVHDVRGRGAADAPEGSIEGSSEGSKEETSALVQPEPDWEAIQAKILGSLDEARDAEIDSYFTSPIEPSPPPRPAVPARIMPRTLPPASPSLAESLARIKQAVDANPAPRQEPAPQRQAPVVEEDLGPSPVAGMDLPTLLGSGAASQRLLRALVAGGLTTAEALERVTFDDLKFMPGVATTGANAIREALGKHGAGLAMDKGRLLLLSRLAADHPKPWPPEVTRADKLALRAGRVRWRALAEADDFKITDIYRAIEAGRRV